MNQTMQTLRHLLAQEDPLDLNDYIRILYEACESRPCCNDADIRQVRDELDGCLADLEFRQQDRVLCTVNALCALYVYAGFSEGFRRGAELVLEMEYDGR